MTEPDDLAVVPSGGRRRIAPLVALALMERIRVQDSPTEVFEEENTSVTMPRRFGLSEVVLQQIHRLEQDVKRKRNLTDGEMGALFRLVIRRPDSAKIFFAVGEELAARSTPRTRLQGLVPARLEYGLARRRTRKALRSLFGRRLGGFAPELFALEGRSLLFIRSDPGGDVCELLTGFCQQAIRNVTGGNERVVHDLCEGRKDSVCRWSMAQIQTIKAAKSVGRASLERLAETDPGVAPARSRLPEHGTAAAS